MQSTLVITTPATDTAILTIAEMRAAAGLSPTDQSQDANLELLTAAVAADIMSACNIAVGSGGEPTLYAETVTQTFYDWPRRRDLILARRHNVAVTSVTEGGSVVASADYSVNAEHGVLTRVGRAAGWSGRPIVVLYTAGFATLPADLKQVAVDVFRTRYAESGRDQFVKSETVDVAGIESKTVDYYVGAIGRASDGPIPGIIVGRLKRYRNAESSIA